MTSKSSSLSLGSKVTILQEAKGISVADIARHLGVNDAIVTRIKKNNLVGSKHIPELAALLGTNASYLTDDEYKPKYTPSMRRPPVTKRIEKLICENLLSPEDQKVLFNLANELADRKK